MLTVAEVLKLPPFQPARVIAGHQGLGNAVLWVHNAGVPDAPDWLNGGELVLTTIINMPETPEDRRRYVLAMADKGIAGLVITVGKYITHIPAYLCEVADECNFPLIEIPYTTRFVDIAKQVNEHIAERNIANVRRAMHIQDTLTQLVLQGGGFRDLARKLAELLRHSISIENERFEAIASENITDVDEARRYTLLHGRTNPALVEALEERILPQIRDTLQPVHIGKMPHVGLEMERILAPIVVHGEIYGYMWIIADDHDLTELDMMAIQSGSTIAALMMLYQESVQSAEASLKGSLLSQLIQGDTSRETILTDQSLRYGVDLRSPYVVMVVESINGGTQHLVQLYRRINQTIVNGGWHAVAGQFAGQVVVLLQANQDAEVLAKQILARIAGNHARNRVGISLAHKGAKAVARAHQQCLDALHIAHRLHDEQAVVYFANLGYLHALYIAGPHGLEGNPYTPLLKRLLEEKQADLFHTLEVYLDAGGNGVRTAELLHIHRSTLNYRLERIHEICRIDLSDANIRINLQVALKLMRLFVVD